MAEIPAQTVAEYIVGCLRYHGDDISNLKLQKLLYYCQAWHLALHGELLFPERIKAWVHGPVVPQVFHYYKDDLHARDWTELPNPTNPPRLPLAAIEHINSVLETYGTFSAYHLERLTHQEEPWLAARGNTPPSEPSEAEILPEIMMQYYRKMADEQTQA